MDNAQKAIMIGVGLFITIIVIAAVMLLLGVGQDLISGGTNQVAGLPSSLQYQLIAKYDGTDISGTEVLLALKQYYNSDLLKILLVINKNINSDIYTSLNKLNTAHPEGNYWFYALKKQLTCVSTQTYVKKTNGTKVAFNEAHNAECSEFIVTKIIPFDKVTPLSDFSDASKNSFIVRGAKYRACLVRMNDEVIGIVFIKL